MSDDARPLRVVLAGCGRIAERAYLPELERLKDVRLVAAIDPREDRRRAAAPLVDAGQVFESLEKCLTTVTSDAIIVATPPASHLATATAAARAGLAMLIEKPLAPCLDGIPEFEAVVRRHRVTVALGFNRRFWRPVNDLRAAIERSGKLPGPVRLVQFGDPVAWAPVASSEGSGPLEDLGSHQFDLLRYIVGSDIAAVSCRALAPGEFEHEVRFTNGSEASGRVGYRVGQPAMESVTCGSWHLDLRSDRIGPARGAVRLGLDAADAVARRLRGRPLSIFRSYELQLADFASSVRNGHPPRATLADGIAAVRCVDAAARSAASGGLEVNL